MPRELEGRLAVVTGGAVRLGRAIALELAAAGADVVVAYRTSEDAARETVESLTSDGSRALAVRADLTREEEVLALFDAAAELGAPSLLVNGAGVYARTPLETLTAADIDRFHALHVRAPLLCTREAVQRFPGGRGAVVNVGDIAGLVPWRGFSAYAASKAALLHLTRCLALELAPRVRVNAVAPGPVLLPPGTEPEVEDALRARVPLGLVGGGAGAVAATVRFLLGGPDWITGHVVPVDGGLRYTDDGDRQA